MGEINSVNQPRRNPSLPFGGLRKILYIAAVSIAATGGFQSVAGAQSTDCSGAAEQLQAERPNVPAGTIEMYLNFVPEVGGCLSFEGTTVIGSLSVPVYDPDTGEEIGIVKDLDPDLSGGDISVTYEEFCGAFFSPTLTAQDYYDQDANDKEQAILDPDSDGLACTSDDDAFLSGDIGETSVPDGSNCIGGVLDRDRDGEISSVEAAQAGADATQGVDPCSGDEGGSGEDGGEREPCSDFEGNSMGFLSYSPEVGGCVLLEGAYPVVGVLNVPVQDPDTRGELGLIKDLDPDLSSGNFTVSFEELCGAFPTPDYAGPSEIAGLTAQEYFDQLANDREIAILDPDGDGLACTSDDDALLSGDYSDYEGVRLEQTWVGLITKFDEDGNAAGEYEIEVELMPVSEMTEGMIGGVVGKSSFSFGCTGIWILEEVNEGSVQVEGRVETGFDNCADAVHTLTPQENGTLDYSASNDSYNYAGRGILTRQGSGALNGDPEDDYETGQFDHTWNGAVTQTAEDGTESEFWVDANIIPVSEMTEDLIGEVVGEVRLVGLDCGGAWVLEEVNVDYVVVEERITDGTVENCVESVPITLTPRDDGTLEYFYPDMNGSVGKCVLTRRGGGLPENDDDTRKPSEKMDRLGMNELPDTGGIPLLPLGGLLLASGALAATISRRTR